MLRRINDINERIERARDDTERTRFLALREELIVACETDTIPWYDLTPDFKDARDLPARDMGIDSANESVAIQVKWREKSRSVSAREIAMFLTSARLGPKPFSRAILATESAVRVARFRESEYERMNMTEAIREKWLAKARALPATIVPVVQQLREYQKEAIECIMARFVQNVAREPVASTSTRDDTNGSDEDELGEESSDDELDESCDTESSISEPDNNVAQVRIKLPCGSGKSLIIAHTIMRVIANAETRVAILVPTIALLDQMHELFATMGITHGLRGTGHNEEVIIEDRVMISVYESAHYLRGPFDMIIVDEAHHLAVPEIYAFEEGVEPGRSPILWQIVKGMLRAKTLLVMLSATLDGADYAKTTEDLIVAGFLCDYDIWIPVWSTMPDPSELARYVALNAGAFESTLIYSNRCERAREIADAMNAIGIACGYFDGTTPDSARKRIIADFRAGILCALSTVGVVAEGADFPRANTCIFADPRESQVAIVQCVGRVLRCVEGKRMAHIVVPCVSSAAATSDASEANNEQLKTDMHAMRKIMNALNCEDSRIKRNIARQSARVYVRAVKVQAEDMSAVEVNELVRQNIYSRVGMLVLSSFDLHVASLRRFVEINGRLPVNREEFEGFKIGSWVMDMRKAKKKNKKYMTAEREADLNAIPGWKWEADPFPDNLDKLRRFVNTNKRLPTYKEKFEEFNIGSWMHTMRRAKKGGEKFLTPEREAELNAIPGWKWSNNPFPVNLDRLQRFVNINKRLPTWKEEFEGFGIGAWVIDLRMKNKKGEKCLTPNRIADLESISGWKWETDPFPANLDKLRRFVDINKRLPTSKEEFEGFKIGRWMLNMRQVKRRGEKSLTSKREAALNAIPGWKWETDPFPAHLDKLRRFVDINKRLPTSKEEFEGFKIGSWVSDMWKAKKNNKTHIITQERETILTSIPYWKWKQDDSFSSNLAKLQKFVEVKNHIPMRTEIFENFKIGLWVHTIRRAKKSGTKSMTPEREAALNAISGWRWSAKNNEEQ